MAKRKKLKEAYIYRRFENGEVEFWEQYKTEEDAHKAWVRDYESDANFFLVVAEEQPWSKR